MTEHFVMRLYRRYGIRATDKTGEQILKQIADGKAFFLCEISEYRKVWMVKGKKKLVPVICDEDRLITALPPGSFEYCRRQVSNKMFFIDIFRNGRLVNSFQET